MGFLKFVERKYKDYFELKEKSGLELMLGLTSSNIKVKDI